MTEVFCVQDRTGTAAQLTIEAETPMPIEVNDTGEYTGLDHTGTSLTLAFTVGAVNDPLNFCITTMTPADPPGKPGDILKSNWPGEGTITWLTGDNSTSSPNSTVVTKRYPANAYCDVTYFMDYHASRGNVFPASPEDPIRQAIVQGTDYLDQRYRYKGVKLLQFVSGNPSFDPLVVFLDPWLLSPTLTGVGFGFGTGGRSFSPSHTSQKSQWPRQGVVDFSGDGVFGVPLVVKDACSELALRQLSGTTLQPDYDPNLVGAGGIVASISEEVGPLRKSRTFDTKLGIGFFPDYPQVRRMLTKAGLLIAGTGRTIIR